MSCRCETCVEALFVKGSGSCPECGTALRKINFRVQLFEDPSTEKEIEIRKKILKEWVIRYIEYCLCHVHTEILASTFSMYICGFQCWSVNKPSLKEHFKQFDMLLKVFWITSIRHSFKL